MEDIKKSYTKEYFIEYRKRYKERFTDKAREAHKEWYMKNKEKAKQNSLRYQEKLRNARNFYEKYYDLINKLDNVFTKEKQRFIDNGYSGSITRDDNELSKDIERCWNEVRDEWWQIHPEKIQDWIQGMQEYGPDGLLLEEPLIEDTSSEADDGH